MALRRVGLTRLGFSGMWSEARGGIRSSLILVIGLTAFISVLVFWHPDRHSDGRDVEILTQPEIADGSGLTMNIEAGQSSTESGKKDALDRKRRRSGERRGNESSRGLNGSQRDARAGGTAGPVSGSGAEGTAPSSELVPTRPDEPPDQDEDGDSEDEDRPARGIAGWVFDEGGTAVADLGLVAQPTRLVAIEAESSGGSFQNSGGRTDGNGFFAFPTLAEGEYALKTEETDTWESTTGQFRTGVDSAVLIVAGKTDLRAVIRGFVESSEGGSLEGVHVLPVGQVGGRVSTDDQGAYALTLSLDSRHRSQMLRFALDGFREHRVTIADAELRSGAEVIRDVLLERLREKTTVSGSVVSGDGSPIHRAHIQLYSASIGRRADGVSDRDGLFSIPDVEQGDDYRLWVRPPDGYKDYLEENLVVTGWVDLDIVVEDVGWARLDGRMIDPVGRPVPGYTLWLRTSQQSGQNNVAVTGDDLGRFVVEQLPEGNVTFATRASPVLTFSGVEIVPRSPNSVRLRLDTGAHRLEGFVLDAGERPVAGAQMALFWSSVEDGVRSSSRRETHSDANGYFLFTNLGGSLHTLTGSAQGFRGARHQLDTRNDNGEVLVRLFEIEP